MVHSHSLALPLYPRYLVRWAGYEPEWEWYRHATEGPAGLMGDPVDTWKPRAALKNTLALAQWESG